MSVKRIDRSATSGVLGTLRDRRAPGTIKVLIATPFEAEHVATISSATSAAEVWYRPELLPPARYPGDHEGNLAALTSEQRQKWEPLLAKAEVLLGVDIFVGDDLPRRAPNLRWVQGTSSGMTSYLERTGLLKSSVIITTAAGIHARPLAEWVQMAALYFVKRLPLLKRWQREHHWERLAVGELAGRRALVLGLGGVGGAIAEVLAQSGVEVVARRRRADKAVPPGVSQLVGAGREWEGSLRTTDFLIVAAPATPATHHLIGAREFDLLPPGAILINVGRGAVVDEAALIEALRTGKLGGAALDVFKDEPLAATSPLWDMPNVIISPHSASTVPDENRRLAELFGENLVRYASGRPLINLFDHDRQY